MAYFICEKQGRCCPHEFYDSIEQAITDSEDGVPCDHLIEVAEVRHGRWEWDTEDIYVCSNCTEKSHVKEVMGHPEWDYCPNCGAKMDGDG